MVLWLLKHDEQSKGNVNTTVKKRSSKMLKKFLFSTAIILLVSSGTFACIGIIDQGQDFTVGLHSMVGLFHGYDSGSSFQMTAVNNGQSASGHSPLQANQDQTAFFVHSGNAEARRGSVLVKGLLEADGAQEQYVRQYGPMNQNQSLGLTSNQFLKVRGSGEGDALNAAVMNQRQDAVNSAGSMNQSSSVVVLQSSDLTGCGRSCGIVVNCVSVETNQNQVVY